MSKTSLFTDFNPVSAKEWKQKIQYDLKGAPYNESLVWESPEGIKVKPFYHMDDGIMVAPAQKSSLGWSVCQSVYAGHASLANDKAKKALQKGAESLWITVPSQEIKIRELLQNIKVRETPIYFKFQFLSDTYTTSMIDFLGEGQKNIFLNIDPIGTLARTGNWFFNLEKDFGILDKMLTSGSNNTLNIDMSLYQNAGATLVQQLAYTLGHANEYLNRFAGKKDLGTLHFQVSVGTNYFFEIAKLRALRWLWSLLAHEYDVSKECHIFAIPTRRNKTLYDYNTNMLRTTTECMSAILGGADTICNMPYDAIYHKENEFGQRIALNQLLLLKNESHFDKVNNAADGAYYIDALTQQLAQKALALFKDIEKKGGFLKQLKEHTIQKKIKESALKEQRGFDAGEEVLVGTNAYPNEADKMKDTIALYPFVKTYARKTLIEPIIEKRIAEKIEQNRLDNE